MKYKDIKMFFQRCEEHPDHQTGMITHSMVEQRLHEEIDELREYIERREWVGLTEEEYKNIRYGSDESGPYVSYGSYDEGYECGSEIEIYVDDFAKAIEAKLKEKNRG